MPRRDVVLTGLIAFSAGVAVGANWPKIRKKIGPLLESLGLQMADLGDFLSAQGHEEMAAEFFQARTTTSKQKTARKTTAKAATRKAVAPKSDSKKSAGFSVVKPSKAKTHRTRTGAHEVPLADGTFGS